jgi:competence protein ComEA
LKDFFNSLFGASSKEITGFSALIIILVISLIIAGIVNSFTTVDDSHWAEDEKILDSLVALLEKDRNTLAYESTIPVEIKYFNPNLASSVEFQSLGFSEKIAKRIINYRDKGGSFKVKDDLYKIYDIDSTLIEELYSFIELPVEIKRVEAWKKQKKDTTVKPHVVTKVTLAELPVFNINTADTAILQTIKGIGSVLSKRIIDFRRNLGGYIDADQLYEVYNLDSMVIESLLTKMYIEDSFIPDKLVINQVDEKELAGHPYISWQQARLIIAYRNQHGDYNTEQDLLKVYGIEQNDVQRIVSYLDWTPSN